MMTSQPKAPDGGWGWVIAFCSFVNHIFMLGSITSFSVLYVSWLDEFGTAKSVTSWIISICISVMFMSGPIAGAVASKVGYRLTNLMGGVLAFSGVFLSSFATSVPYLMISIGIITGFGYGLVFLSSLANVVVYFDKKRALATCIGTSGSGVGSFIIAPLLNALTDAYGWRGAVLVFSGLVLHLCVTGMLMRPLASNNNFNAAEESPKKTVDREMYQLAGEGKQVERPHEMGEDETELFISLHSDDVVQIESAPDAVLQRVQDEDDRTFINKDITGASQSKPVESERSYRDTPQPSDIEKDDTDNLISSCKPLNEQEGDATESDVKPLGTINNDASRRDRNSESNTSRNPIIALCNSGKCKSNSNLQCCFKYTTRFEKGMKAVFHKNKEVVNEPAFIFLALSQFLVSLSSVAPIIFIVDRAIHNNIAKSTAVWLISFYGIGSLSGRLFWGMLADKYMTNHLVTYIILLTVNGVATSLSPLCGGNFILNGMYAGIFGFCIGGVASLSVIVIVDLMGLTKVATTLGLLLFCAGLGHILGPPIGGFVYDLTDSYVFSYVCHGIFLAVSGGVLLPVCCTLRRKGKRAHAEQSSSRQTKRSHENLVVES